MATRVLVDANVLFSRTLRDWILQLSLSSEMFRCFGTEHIYAEAAYHLQRKRPNLDGAVLTQFRKKFEECLNRIEEFPALPDFPGDDLNDQHLHSAAMAGSVSFIVTCDKRLIAAAQDRDDLPYEIWDIDEFLTLVDDSEDRLVRAVAREQIKHYRARYEDFNLVERLQSSNCPQFAERVRVHLLAIL